MKPLPQQEEILKLSYLQEEWSLINNLIEHNNSYKCGEYLDAVDTTEMLAQIVGAGFDETVFHF